MKKFIFFDIISTLILAVNGWQYYSRDNWISIPFGRFWFETDSGSLNLSQAIIERYISPNIWSAFLPVLEAPAWIVMLCISGFFFFIGFFFLAKHIRKSRKLA